MKLEKKWYTIKQVVEKWKRDGIDCTKDDVLHLIQTHKINPSFFLPETKFTVMRKPDNFEKSDNNGNLLDPDGYDNFYDDFFKNAPIETYSGLFSPIGFSADDNGLLSVKNQWHGDTRGLPLLDGEPRYVTDNKEYLFYPAEPIQITPADFLITAKELERYEAYTLQRAIHLKVADSYLDPNHNHYSKELAVAVKTWRTLYDDGGTFKAKKSHKEQIKAAIAGNGLSDAAIDRIATLVNPNKAGGAPSTDF